MTPEQYERFVEKANRIGLPMNFPEVSEERKQQVVKSLRENSPVDYFALMK